MTAKANAACGPDSKTAGISSSAVARGTGRTWEQWFRLLDRAGGAKMEHKTIAALLHEKHGLSGWWAQMVTVGYEQGRLGRRKHQKPGGFEVSVSKTVGVPLGRLYRAWSDKRVRRRWLPEADFTVRKATKDTSMRITWIDGTAHVDANFTAKGPGKSQVAVHHKKLTSARGAESAKRLWRERLTALKEQLES